MAGFQLKAVSLGTVRQRVAKLNIEDDGFLVFSWLTIPMDSLTAKSGLRKILHTYVWLAHQPIVLIEKIFSHKVAFLRFSLYTVSYVGDSIPYGTN